MDQGSRRILVVEDEPLVRMFAADILAEAGYAVLEAGTADEALQIITTGTPLAAVMTDIEMPGSVDGLELARLIDANWPTIAVVLVSGRRLPRPDELPQQALFLAKPYSQERLIDTLEAVMNESASFAA
jgi:CheY-like chemotaxis protein